MFEVAILVLSDKGAKGDREDRTGAMLKESVKAFGWEVVYYEVLPDERIYWWKGLFLCVTMLGRSGVNFRWNRAGTRDITPEATLKVVIGRFLGLVKPCGLTVCKRLLGYAFAWNSGYSQAYSDY